MHSWLFVLCTFMWACCCWAETRLQMCKAVRTLYGYLFSLHTQKAYQGSRQMPASGVLPRVWGPTGGGQCLIWDTSGDADGLGQLMQRLLCAWLLCVEAN